MTIQTEAIDARTVAALRARMGGALLRPGEEGYDEEASRVDEPERFVEIYPTGPSSGAVTTARPDGSVLAGRALDRLSASALGRTLCAS